MRCALGVALLVALLQVAPLQAAEPWSATALPPVPGSPYLPLAVTVAEDAPAVVRLSASGAVTVMWRRGDATSAVLPLQLTQPTGPSVTVQLDDIALPVVLPDRLPQWPGPTALASEAAYAPTFSWTPSPDHRRPLVLLAVLLLGACGALLLRRWAAVTSTALLVASIGACIMLLPAGASQLRGDVRVAGADPFVDRWTYLAVAEARTVSLPADGVTWVVPFDSMHFQQLQPTLHVEPDGTPRRLELHLPARGRVAVVSRSTDADPLLPPPRGLVKALYLADGWVAGPAGLVR